MSPLDFLQKKKEQLAKSAPPPETAAGEEAPEAKAAEAEDADVPHLKQAPPKKKKKSAAEAAQEALERMKGKVSGGLPEAPAGDESPAAGRSSDEPAPEEESAEQASAKKRRPAEEEKEAGDLKFSEQKPEEAPELKDLKFGPEKERKKKKQKVLEDIRAELAKPLPDYIPEEEAAEMKKELGLDLGTELPAPELARKHRAAKIKKMKDGLLDLPDPSSDESPAPVNQHDLRPDETPNTWSEGGPGAPEERVKRRAFDSDLSEEGPEAEREAAPKRKKEKKSLAEHEEPYSYLPEATVTPPGGAWDSTAEHFVFLAGEVKYRGFDKLDDLLPLWVYRGDTVPELLDKDKIWRFRGAAAVEIRAVAEIPQDVRDFLLSLRGETASSDKPKEEKEKREPKRGLNAPEAALEEEKAVLEPTREEAAEKPETQADTLEELFEKKAKTAVPAEEPPSSAGSVTEQLEMDASPSMQAFLERRKRKQEKSAARETERARTESTNPYLGIYVALSNAFGPMRDRVKAAARALKTMEASFGDCQAAVVSAADAEGFATVRFSGGGVPASASRVKLASGFQYPIQRHGGESGEILGYLWINPTGARKELSTMEQKAAEKTALTLWPILSGAPAPEEKKAA